jgi:NAD(P)H-dependent FMN reductase
MGEKGIQIVVITGSVRPGNYTRMAAELVVDELKKQSTYLRS